MKLTLIGDMHITDKRPSCRNDKNYAQTCMYKLHEALLPDTDLVLQAGDFFDSHTISNRILGDTINLLRVLSKQVLCVFGQHDKRFHSIDHSDTALRILCETLYVSTFPLQTKAVSITACHFGMDIPEPQKSDFNILILHKMITKSGPLFPGQIDFVPAKDFLEKHNYDLILSGDNHQTFIEEMGGRFLVNPGCMMRKTIDMIDHEPCFFIFDTDSKQLEQHFFTAPKDVFVQHEKKFNFDAEMEELVNDLKSKAKLEGVSFVDNLYILSKDQRGEIKDLLNKSIEKE